MGAVQIGSAGIEFQRQDRQLMSGAPLHISLIGARPNLKGAGIDRLPGFNNYFIGTDSSKWRVHVPQFRNVRFTDVYPGIDIVYYGTSERIEYDFILKPGADPARIALTSRDAQNVSVTAGGDVVFASGATKVIQRKPVIYQEIEGRRRNVEGSFYLAEDRRTIRLAVTSYEHTRDLVVDPILEYATYIGGSSDDYGESVAVDSHGYAYVTGWTRSLSFPRTSGQLNCHDAPTCSHYDVFVTKINPAGTAVIYSTFIGGSGDDWGRNIVVDTSGNTYVTGPTSSTDFPLVNAFQTNYGGGSTDAFFFKLDPTGTALLASSYLGGAGSDTANELRLDKAGNIYLAGQTDSTDFPTKLPLQAKNAGYVDIFLTKLDPSGASVLYSTYFGGSSWDSANDIDLDEAGNIYIAGTTYSTDYPVKAAYQSAIGGKFDAFVTKLNPVGSAVIYSTFLGGSDEDQAWALEVDAQGEAIITGLAKSGDFPVFKAYQPAYGGGAGDVFLSKLSASGKSLLFSTYLGGSGLDWAYDMSLDSEGDIYVSGYSDSLNFPTANATQPANAGGADAFAVKLDPLGSRLLFSTYFGGSGFDQAGGVTVDSDNNVYLTGVASYSFNFPSTSSRPIQNYGGGTSDAFLTKLANADITLIAKSGGSATIMPAENEGVVIAGPRPPAAGSGRGSVTFNLTVQNMPGSDTAENVGLTAALPTSLQLVSCSYGAASCSSGPNVSIPPGLNLPPGASVDVSITAQLTSTAVPGQSITIPLRARSDTNDPNETNNSTSVQLYVEPRPVHGQHPPHGAH
jgi:hypothetical protein